MHQVEPLRASLFVGGSVFLLYAMTASRGVAGGDSGELLSETCLGGVAHPPGYPLFLFLGRIASLVLGSSAWMLNVAFSALGAVAAGGLTYAVLSLADDVAPVFGYDAFFSTARWAVAAGTGVLFALSPVTWAFSVTAEVFSLNNAIAVALLVLLIHFERSLDAMDDLSPIRLSAATAPWRPWTLAGAFVAGLGASNQHMILFLFGPVALWVAARLLLLRSFTLAHAGHMLACFALGLTPYLLLILRSFWPTPGSWGDLTSIAGLVRHFTRGDYGSLRLTASNDESTADSSAFYARLAAYFGHVREVVPVAPLVFVLALAGAVAGVSHALQRRGKHGGVQGSLGARFRVACFCLGTWLLYVLAFHWLANIDATQPVARGVLMRFWMQPDALLLAGLGLFLFDGVAWVGRVRGPASASHAPPAVSASAASATSPSGRTALPLNASPATLSLVVAVFFLLLVPFRIASVDYAGTLSTLLGQRGAGSTAGAALARSHAAWLDAGAFASTETIFASKFASRPGASPPALAVDPSTPPSTTLDEPLTAPLPWSAPGSVVESFGRTILLSLPPDSLLLSFTDINWNSVRFLQSCRGERPDVQHLSLQLLPYPWFARQQFLFPNVSFPAVRPDASTDLRSPRYIRDLATFLHFNAPRWPNGIFLDLHAVPESAIGEANRLLVDESVVGDVGATARKGRRRHLFLVPHGLVWRVVGLDSPASGALPGAKDFFLRLRDEMSVDSATHAAAALAALAVTSANPASFGAETWEHVVSRIAWDAQYQYALFLLSFEVAVGIDEANKPGRSRVWPGWDPWTNDLLASARAAGFQRLAGSRGERLFENSTGSWVEVPWTRGEGATRAGLIRHVQRLLMASRVLKAALHARLTDNLATLHTPDVVKNLALALSRLYPALGRVVVEPEAWLQLHRGGWMPAPPVPGRGNESMDQRSRQLLDDFEDHLLAAIDTYAQWNPKDKDLRVFQDLRNAVNGVRSKRKRA